MVNAVSECRTVPVHRGGKIYEMKFSRGHVTQEMTVVGTTDRTGTTVTFKPDSEMFDTTVYNYETIHTRMQQQAFLNAGLQIRVFDRRPGQAAEDTPHYEGGIRQYVTWPHQNNTPLHRRTNHTHCPTDEATVE